MEKLPERRTGKREARKQERREAILAIATRVFLEQGYSAASMSAIAAELGGSKGTLWSYFPSKEELFAAVLDEATSEYRLRLADLLKPGEDVRSAILQFCKSFLAKIMSPDGIRLHRLVAAEVARFPEVGAIFFRRAPQPTQQLLCGFFEREMAAGTLRRDDPLFAARVLASLCTGVQQRMMWGLTMTDAERDREAELITDLFLRAFAPE